MPFARSSVVKNILSTLFATQFCLISLPTCAVTISNYEDFVQAAENGGKYELSSDLTFDNTTRIYFNHETTIDGKGNSLTSNIKTDQGFIYISGEDSGHIGYEGKLHLTNLGDFGFLTPGKDIDIKSIEENIGIYGFKNTIFTIGHAGGELEISSSIIQNNQGTSSSSSVFQVEHGGSLSIKDSIVFNNSSPSQGSVIRSLGGDINIKNSSFIQNVSNSDGGVIHLFSYSAPVNLRISNSYFRGNKSIGKEDLWGGVIRVQTADSIIINSSVFKGNSAEEMGGVIYSDDLKKLVIQDSQFLGNSAGKHGAAIAINKSTTETFIIANQSDTIFSGNSIGDGSHEAIYLHHSDSKLNLNAYGNHSIIFDDSIRAELGEDGTPKAILNINSDISKILDHAPAHESDGSIIFNEEIGNFNINFADGTLKLLSEKTNQGLLSTSVLDINGGKKISTVDSQGLLRTIRMGGLKIHNDSSLELDVDLSAGLSDKFELAESGTVEGCGKLQISHWNVLQDSKLEQITVSVTDIPLREYIELSSSANKAQGPIYTYDVSKTTDGDYLFSRKEATPENVNPNLYGAAVSLAGVGVVNHLVRNNMLDRQLLTRDGHGQSLWADLIGSNLDMNPGNFHDINYQYAIGLLGYTSAPFQIGPSELSLTGYIGGVYGDVDYQNIGISQNGFMGGVSAVSRINSLWFSVGLDLGYTSSSIKENHSDDDVNTPWYSLSLATGYDLDFNQFSVTPYFMASWISADGDSYRTSSEVKVNLENVRMTEFTPGVRFNWDISDTWKAYANTRYNFVNVNSGCQQVNQEVVGEISFENYVEYSLGLTRLSKDWLLNVSVERNNDGRQGWNSRIQSSWYF